MNRYKITVVTRDFLKDSISGELPVQGVTYTAEYLVNGENIDVAFSEFNPDVAEPVYRAVDGIIPDNHTEVSSAVLHRSIRLIAENVQ